MTDDDTAPQSSVTLSSAGPCDGCRRRLPPLKDVAEEFFLRGAVTCQACGKPVDLWESAQEFTKTFGAAIFTLPALGAHLTAFVFDLGLHESKPLDFADYGVPSAGIVLAVGYTPNGTGCFPVEVHGNDARRRYRGTEVKVYGVPFPPGSDAKGTPSQPIPIACAVCWIHETDDTEPWLFLADAFEAIADWRLARMIVPAHSAFEVSLARLIRAFGAKFASRERLDEFMVRDLSAPGALNVMLPIVCSQADVPMLRDDIRGALNGLRKLRNQVVHDGLTDASIDKGDAVRSLAGAVFGFEFVRLVRSRLGL